MIVVENVHKRYGEQIVLDGISLRILKGTVTSIIGRSGGGKSVLLKHLIGLERPDKGTIAIDGENLFDMSAPDLNKMRRRFGVLFQEGALFDSRTVSENVAFPVREHTSLSEEEIQELVTAKLAAVGLSHHADKLPAQISGGMRKRVGLARALALEPEIVFFDEPTTGLDPIIRSAIYALLVRTHRERSITYVVVSHDIEGVFHISDEIMMLWDGRIVARGTAEEMRNSPNPIVRQFITGSLKGPIHAE
jgi:phospholipid/cholesterol/gamma-HCH transport system ATP-binding protein